MSNWISSKLKWDKPTIDNEILNQNLVFDLIDSKSEETAKKAFWKLDGTVCLNGALSDSALDVTKCILASLPICEVNANLKCIDLLVEIISSKPVSSKSTVLIDCLDELNENSWYFLNVLEYGKFKDVSNYVDLICLLAIQKENFRYKAIIYLCEILRKRELSETRLIVLKNSIDELQSM